MMMTLQHRRMRPLPLVLCLLALVLASAWPLAAAWAQGKGTGLPLPRFVSLRAGEVNMRTGPGVQYPVDWVYHRQNMPMEVIHEYGTWRKVRDVQGTEGWIHQSMLSGRRGLVITGAPRTLRRDADPKSDPVVQAEPGVIGQILACPETSIWCRVQIDTYEGWMRRVEFWGVYREEEVR